MSKSKNENFYRKYKDEQSMNEYLRKEIIRLNSERKLSHNLLFGMTMIAILLVWHII
tara:strand:- start:769 stop:939 length:171 start_codon:yes stop_codon:yes gene_type:complete